MRKSALTGVCMDFLNYVERFSSDCFFNSVQYHARIAFRDYYFMGRNAI